MQIKTFILPVLMLIMSACGNSETVSRIPDASVSMRVNIDYWKLSAVLNYHRFTDKQGLPESSFLGFGGILLVNGFPMNGESVAFYAYDLSCPVEARPDVRVVINSEHLQAECPKCKSRYAVFEGGGFPTFGEAKEKSYYLKRYNVRLSGRDVLISR